MVHFENRKIKPDDHCWFYDYRFYLFKEYILSDIILKCNTIFNSLGISNHVNRIAVKDRTIKSNLIRAMYEL